MGITQQIGASSLIKPGVIDNTAARPASPFEGQVIFQKDTDQLLVWNGTAWVIPNSPAQNPTGLELITTATFSATATKISLPIGTFTTTYDSYRIVFRVTAQSAAGAVTYSLIMRSAGTDSTSSSWNTFSSGIDRAGTAITRTGTDTLTSPLLDSYSSAFPNMVFTLDVHAPMLAQAKYVTGHSTQILKGTSVNSVMNTTSTFDSLSFLIDTGNITGTYYVYGYRK